MWNKHTMRKLSLYIAAIFSLLIMSTLTQTAFALSGSDFQSGRIIDDGVFFQPSTMDTASIQTFLNSKVPSCDTNGTQPYNGTTRGAYGASKGYPAPYTCLRDYSMATPDKAAETGLCRQ